MTRIYAVVLGAVILFCSSFLLGHNVAKKSCEIKMSEQREDYIRWYEAQVTRYNDLAAELEIAKNETRTIYQTIEKEVPKIVVRDVYRNSCIDADGVRVINQALTRNGSRTGKPAAAVPAADPARRDDRRNHAQKDH